MSPRCHCGAGDASLTGLPDGRDRWLCDDCADAWWTLWYRWSERAPTQANRVRARACQRRIARAEGIAADGSRMQPDGGFEYDDPEHRRADDRHEATARDRATAGLETAALRAVGRMHNDARAQAVRERIERRCEGASAGGDA